MHWSAEEFVLVITAFLFLGLVVSSYLPGVELTSTSRATFAIGAAAFVGAAAALARYEDAHFPVFLWALPAIPIIIAGFVVRDAVARSRRISLGHRPRRPAVSSAAAHAAAREAILLRELAANPAATPQELASIAYSHPEMRATIAGNPSAPASLLAWLADMGDTAVHAAISARMPATTAVRARQAS